MPRGSFVRGSAKQTLDPSAKEQENTKRQELAAVEARRASLNFWLTGSSWLAVVALAIFIYVAIGLSGRVRLLIESGDSRYASHVIAEELRQSSDDLTRMVRTYVITGNEIFYKQFQAVQAIRDGMIGRLPDAQQMYWDLTSSFDLGESGERSSLMDQMVNNGFTSDELASLRNAKESSDALINLEQLAVRAVRDKLTSVEKKQFLPGETSRDFAIRQLFGPKYHEKKAQIMSLINDVSESVEARTTEQFKSNGRRSIIKMWISGGLIFIILVSMIVSAVAAIRISGIQARIAQMMFELEKTQFEHAANHDPVTGLANRRMLESRFVQAIDSSNATGFKTVLFYIDLNNFKPVNDEMGHAYGDRVLCDVAERLNSCVRGTDLVARVGGDEFVVLLQSVKDVTILERMLDKMRAVATTEAELPGRNVKVTSSFGTAVYPDDAKTMEQLIKVADTRMYEDKMKSRTKERVMS